jgi:hypothetical protein
LQEHLFSYGTLQLDEVQLDLFGRILNGSKDTLHGYKVSPIEITDELFLSKGGGKHQRIAIVTHNQTDQIEGMVFEVSGDELLHADKYEPVDYKRIKVILASGQQAWVYAGK